MSVQSEVLSASFAAKVQDIRGEFDLISKTYGTKVFNPEMISKSVLADERVQARIQKSWDSTTASVIQAVDPFLNTAFASLQYVYEKATEQVSKCTQTLHDCLEASTQFVSQLHRQKEGFETIDSRERDELTERLRLLQERMNLTNGKLLERLKQQNEYLNHAKSVPVHLSYVESKVIQINLSATNFRSKTISSAYVRVGTDIQQNQDVPVATIHPGAQIISVIADQIDFASVHTVTFTLCWGSESSFREISKPLIVDFTDRYEKQPDQQIYGNDAWSAPVMSQQPDLHDESQKGEFDDPHSSLKSGHGDNAPAFLLNRKPPEHSMPIQPEFSAEQLAQSIVQEFPNAGTQDEVAGWFRNDPSLTYEQARIFLQNQQLGQSQY